MSQDRALQELYRVCMKSAKKAGSYLLKRFLKRDTRIEKNLRYDVKLDVDIEAENIIKGILRKHFPKHGFICEESGSDASETGQNWIIDPLDGTVNFSRGIPHFCTSIAFRQNNTYLVGVVFDPVRNETFSAIRGRGAFFNNRPINRRGVINLEEAIVGGAFFKPESLERGSEAFVRMGPRVKKVRFFGAGALDICYLACGRINAVLQQAVNEWDIAAALLIAEMTGVRIEVSKRANKLDLIGADREIFDAIRQHTL